ncbi:MAG: T9SS type A sorting domain-containing protein [Bacteriovoracaceae bacterium]
MKTLLTFLLSILTLTGFSQSISITGTITSSGQTFHKNGITLDFAAGQPILMGTTSNNILFDGFVVSEAGSVGVEEINEQLQLTFYPNPTIDFIQTDKTNIEMLSVYNLNGALVKQVSMSSRIDVSDLTTGIYILVAETNNQLSQFKFIKK